MRDLSDRSPLQSANATHKKRLGGYLVEAGLLTPSQVDVALNDQKLTGMRFGEILAARGWVKQQTIEYLMNKVVLPEQQATKQGRGATVRQDLTVHQRGAIAVTSTPSPAQPAPSDINKHPARRDAPISKPLPSVGQPDSDVSWVG